MPDADSGQSAGAGWHQQDILAEIRKRGSTVAALNRAHGFRPGVLNTVFYKRWPKGQRIVAEFIGVPVEALWPYWYGPGGVRKPLQGGSRRTAA